LSASAERLVLLQLPHKRWVRVCDRPSRPNYLEGFLQAHAHLADQVGYDDSWTPRDPCKAVTQHFAALFASQRFVDKRVTRFKVRKQVGIQTVVYADVEDAIGRPWGRPQPWDILAHRNDMCNPRRIEYLFIRRAKDVGNI